MLVNWEVVDQLAKESGISNDAELARLGRVEQSVITRARRGSVGAAAVAALTAAFPATPMGRMFIAGRTS